MLNSTTSAKKLYLRFFLKPCLANPWIPSPQCPSPGKEEEDEKKISLLSPPHFLDASEWGADDDASLPPTFLETQSDVRTGRGGEGAIDDGR